LTKIFLPVKEERIVYLAKKGDTLAVMTRSFLLFGLVNTHASNWQQVTLPPPEGFLNQTTLFKTLWVIHSGEIYGIAGKLIIDFAGFVFIFLAITGLIYFFMPGILKKRKRKQKPVKRHARLNPLSLRWHNKVGIWLVAILIINVTAGMFLRPPLLIIPLFGIFSLTILITGLVVWIKVFWRRKRGGSVIVALVIGASAPITQILQYSRYRGIQI